MQIFRKGNSKTKDTKTDTRIGTQVDRETSRDIAEEASRNQHTRVGPGTFNRHTMSFHS